MSLLGLAMDKVKENGGGGGGNAVKANSLKYSNKACEIFDTRYSQVFTRARHVCFCLQIFRCR
jgi:hypothetical protein